MADHDTLGQMLAGVSELRRNFLRKLVVGSGFVRPAIASFTMSGLVIADASVAVANVTTRPSTVASTTLPSTIAPAPGPSPTPAPSPSMGSTTDTPIPEPGSIALLGSGVAVVGGAALASRVRDRVRLLLERWAEDEEP